MLWSTFSGMAQHEWVKDTTNKRMAWRENTEYIKLTPIHSMVRGGGGGAGLTHIQTMAGGGGVPREGLSIWSERCV